MPAFFHIPRQIGDFIGGGSFLSVGPQAIAKYLKYFACLGSRLGTNHALAGKESSKAKPRYRGGVWYQFFEGAFIGVLQAKTLNKRDFAWVQRGTILKVRIFSAVR